MTFEKVMVTGHRPQDFDETERWMVVEWLESMARWLKADKGGRVAITGMALGVDTWWGLKALSEGWTLEAHVPFWGQRGKWPAADQELWMRMLDQSQDVRVYGNSEPYDARLFHERNDGMIEACDLAIVVWSGKEAGGTYSAFKKIKAAGVPWIWYDYRNNRVETSEGLM